MVARRKARHSRKFRLYFHVYPMIAAITTFYTDFSEIPLPCRRFFDIIEAIVEGCFMNRASLPDFSIVRGQRLLIALSGGADSVALSCMLVQRRDALGLTLFAAHVDHSIRGEESRADAEYCRVLCERLDIPFYLERVDVPASRLSGEGVETAARRLRYEALRRVRTQTGADWIVLAHHQDDQAETVLMHLLRGSGPDGAGGMAECSGDLYRPLLNTPKCALEDFLTEQNIPWRTDRTNLTPCTPRNALRLHGLPALEESYPGAKAALARHAESMRCENRFMENAVDAFLRDHFDSGPYGRRIRHPEQADEAILRRAIQRICGPSLSHDALLSLTALCRSVRGRHSVSASLLAEKTPGAIYFLPVSPELPEPVPLSVPGEQRLNGLGLLRLQFAAPIPIRDDPFRQVLAQDAISGAVLRTRRDGDRIRPLGCGDRLLSDVLTDRKMDRPLRDALPLVAKGNRVLWAVGVCISEDAKLTPETSDAVLLEWHYDTP